MKLAGVSYTEEERLHKTGWMGLRVVDGSDKIGMCQIGGCFMVHFGTPVANYVYTC
jgi:hypothetical protein